MRLTNHLAKIVLGALVLALSSCSDDRFADNADACMVLPGDRAATIEVPLRLHADAPSVIGKPLVNDIVSRADGDAGTPADPEQAAEEAIKNIWVFQFDSIGNQLIAPRYYEVASTEIRKLNIRLAEGEDSYVYVLANTCDPDWAKGKDLSTVEKFVGYEYPFTEDNVEMGKDEYLLMEGNVKETIRKETDLLPIDIHLTRMMAKISFKYVTADAAKGLKVTRVIINNMPEKMRMEETPIEENYPKGDFAVRSVSIDKNLASDEIYTFYMPANRRGETTNTDAALKNNEAPDKALYVQLFVSSETNGSNFLYTIYLGANDTNDFNVRRNHNYNIKLNINSESRDDRVLAAPANCYVLAFNDSIMFDPYNRTEKGGGWVYSDYVKKGDPDKEFTKVEVLWQEVNVIGDNSKGDRVYLDRYNRVHVRSRSTAGNAVIAGYNAKGDIVWSWHVWVNNEMPAKLSKAVPYNTFAWDSNGIKVSEGRKVKGRSLMQCNLGAHSATKTGRMGYGAVYQWGRKDPFPIGWMIDNQSSGAYMFTKTSVGLITDNANKEIKMTTDGGRENCGELFDYRKTNSDIGNIPYVLKHPTVFLGATNTETSSGAMSSDSWRQPASWVNNGDWYWGGKDTLWGGKPFSEAKEKFCVHKKGEEWLDVGKMAVDGWLSDNGAKEKSLFDPCPAGWMVPPADLWLSFTSDGKNSGWGSNATSRVNGTFQSGIYGHKIYVQKWKGGPTVYFPSNGFRNSNGTMRRNGNCGNYHTSTPSTDGTVNCFHIHNASAALPFESGYESTRRAFAGPVRCVRDVDE